MNLDLQSSLRTHEIPPMIPCAALLVDFHDVVSIVVQRSGSLDPADLAEAALVKQFVLDSAIDLVRSSQLSSLTSSCCEKRTLEL